MKKTVRTSRTAGYLEKMFRELNNDLFGGTLEEPIITIQSTPRAYGHVSVAKIWRRSEENRHELNIGADTLARPIEEVVATMVHEMCHLSNMQRGIQDTSRGYTYHNKHFRDEAERRLLQVDHHPQYGWTITSCTDKLFEYILEKGWSEIEMNRSGGIIPPSSSGGKNGNGSGAAPGPAPRKSSTRKYICPCCGQSVRATKTVNIICGDCMEKMIEA